MSKRAFPSSVAGRLFLAILLVSLALAARVVQAQPVGAGWGGPYEIYQVRQGDTVENIAARFGIAPELIRTFNLLPDSVVLALGQDLAIPLPASAKAGEGRPGPGEPAKLIPPRFAVVATPGPIMSELSGGRLLYEPARGTRLVVKVDRGEHWGVVMVDGSIGWIAKGCVEVSEQTIPPEQLDTMLRGGRPDIVQEAARYLGAPYRYGGNLLNGVDCSLLVQAACGARGLQLPRTAAAQFEVGRPVGLNGLQPGDRLYFVSKSGRISHTGLYIGNAQFIHASARRGCVAVDSLSDSFYWSRLIGARRF